MSAGSSPRASGRRPGGVAAVLLCGVVVLLAGVLAPVPVGATGSDTGGSAPSVEDCETTAAADADGLTVTGCLSEGETETLTLDSRLVGDEATLVLRGPSGADFDLLVSKDGSRPTLDNADRTSRGAGPVERLTVESDGEVAVAVTAVDGGGEFTLQVRSGSAADSDPSAEFTVTPGEPSVGEPTTLQATPTPGATYRWKFADGTSARGSTVEHTFERPGAQRVRLTVVGENDTATTTETVNVSGASVGPTARIDASATAAAVGESVTFDASGSSTPGDATYLWRFDDGTTAQGAVVKHAFENPGPHDVHLTVTTDAGSDTALHTVTVAGSGGAITPRVDLGTRDEGVVYLGEAVRVSAAGSTAAAGIERYAFEFGDGEATAGPSPYAVHRYDSPGTHTLSLTVTDENGDTRTVTREVEVVRPRVAITGVSGLEDPVFEPIGLFANCGELGVVRTETVGTESVQRVEFTVSGETFVDDTPADGFTMPRAKFPKPGRVMKVTAVTESGRTDTVTVPVELADAPDGLVGYLVNADHLVKGYNKINGNGTDVPASVGNCELTVTWPTWAKDVSDTFESGQGYDLPGNVQEYIEPPSQAAFATQFRLRYRPGQRQVTVGGAGSAQLLFPPKETNVQTGVSVNGVYTVPEWNLTNVAFGGTIDGNYHLEDWVVPLPTTEVDFDFDGPEGPMPGVSLGLPLDLVFGPELTVSGGIAPSFEPDTVNARLQGEVSLRGEAGGRIAAIDTPVGEYEVETGSAWAEGALQTDRMQVVPFDPTLAGQFLVNYGVKVDVPFVPSSVMDPYKWERTHEWDLQPSVRPAVGSGIGSGAAAVRTAAGHTVTEDVGRQAEPHLGEVSPGARVGDPVVDTGADASTDGNTTLAAGPSDAAPVATGSLDPGLDAALNASDRAADSATVITADRLPDGEPSLSTTDDGYLLAWSHEPVDETAGRQIRVAAAGPDGWTDAGTVTDGSAYDSQPSVAYSAATGEAMVVWTRVDTSLGPDATGADAMNATEVYYSRLTDGTWSEPRPLTDDAGMDVAPRVVAHDGGFVVVWAGVTDSNGGSFAVEHVRIGDGPGEVHSRSVPRVPVRVAAGDRVRVAYMDSTAAQADGDGAVVTLAREGGRLREVARYEARGLRSLSVGPDGVAWVGTVDNRTRVMYGAGGESERVAGAMDVSAVGGVRVAEGDGFPVVTYRGVPDGAESRHLVYATRQGGEWVAENVVGGTAAADLDLAETTVAGGETGFAAAFTGRALTRPEQNRDVFAVTHEFRPDLTADAQTARLDDDRLQVSLSVRNRGELAAETVRVRVVGDGETLATREVGSLAPGERATATVDVDEPASGQVTVVADPVDAVTERSERNNATSAVSARADAAVTAVDARRTGEETATVSATVTNGGSAVATDVTATMADEAGPVEERRLGRLGVGETRTVEFTLGLDRLDRAGTRVTVDAATDADDINDSLRVRGLRPDLQVFAPDVTFRPAGDRILTTVLVTNVGDARGTYPVRVRHDGAVVATAEATLDRGLPAASSDRVAVRLPADLSGEQVTVVADAPGDRHRTDNAVSVTVPSLPGVDEGAPGVETFDADVEGDSVVVRFRADERLDRSATTVVVDGPAGERRLSGDDLVRRGPGFTYLARVDADEPGRYEATLSRAADEAGNTVDDRPSAVARVAGADDPGTGVASLVVAVLVVVLAGAVLYRRVGSGGRVAG